RLAVALQAVLHLLEQRGHRLVADLMAHLLQGSGQLAQALAGPAQRRLGMAAGGRLDQGLQISPHGRIVRLQALAPRARTARPGARGPVVPAGRSSRTPTLLAWRERRAARATSVIPPCPTLRASLAASARRARSSKLPATRA